MHLFFSSSVAVTYDGLVVKETVDNCSSSHSRSSSDHSSSPSVHEVQHETSVATEPAITLETIHEAEELEA